MHPHTETYDRIGDVPVWVHDLERRWEQEEARGRVRVAEEDAILDVSVATTVPPQVAWEFLTTPGQRMTWQPWVTEVTIKGATGGRRGPGSANHCMHGKDAVVEEILDWRPYDYVTDRTILDTPGGPVKVLHTIELEPGPEGTTVHFRFGRAEDEAGEGADGAHRTGVWRGAAVRAAEPRRPAGGTARGPWRGRKPRARAGPAQPGRPPGRDPAAADRRLTGPGWRDQHLAPIARPRAYSVDRQG